MRTPNKNLITSLTEFATNVEGPVEDLSSEEVAEKLLAHGVDLMKLDARTVKKLRKLRAQLEPSSGLKGLIVSPRTKRTPLIAAQNEERQKDGNSVNPTSSEQPSDSKTSDSD